MQLNRHKYISSHHSRTRREYCRKLVSWKCTATLQKARQITESHSGIPRCVELCKVCACSSGIMRAALRCSRLPQNSMFTMLFSNARTAQMLLLRGLACRLNSPPSCVPTSIMFDAGSNSVCKAAKLKTNNIV